MHYILDCEPGRPIVQGPDVEEAWTEGRALESPPREQPLVFTLDPGAATEPAAMYEGITPVWSEDLLVAMREAGVDNLETYRAQLLDPRGGRVWQRYWAVNVVGLVE